MRNLCEIETRSQSIRRGAKSVGERGTTGIASEQTAESLRTCATLQHQHHRIFIRQLARLPEKCAIRRGLHPGADRADGGKLLGPVPVFSRSVVVSRDHQVAERSRLLETKDQIVETHDFSLDSGFPGSGGEFPAKPASQKMPTERGGTA